MQYLHLQSQEHLADEGTIILQNARTICQSLQCKIPDNLNVRQHHLTT